MESSFAYLDHIPDWEDSDESITIGSCVIKRFVTLSDIITRYLSVDGTAVDHQFINMIVLCLPSFTTPRDFFMLLRQRFDIRNLAAVNQQILIQQQIKILTIIYLWSRQSWACSDISGQLLEDITNFCADVISECFEDVAKAAKKVKALLKKLKSNLGNLDKAVAYYQQRTAHLRQARHDETVSGVPPVRPSGVSLSMNHIERVSECDEEDDGSSVGSFAGSCASHLSRSSLRRASESSLASVSLGGNNSEDRARSDRLIQELSEGGYFVGSDIFDKESPRGSSQRRSGKKNGSVLAAALFGDRGSTMKQKGVSSKQSDIVLPPSATHSSHWDEVGKEERCDGIDSTVSHTASNSDVENPNAEISIMKTPEKEKRSRNTENAEKKSAASTPCTSQTKSGCSSPAPSLTWRFTVVRMIPFEKLAEFLAILEYEENLLSIRAREFIGLAWTRKHLKAVHPDIGGSAHLCRAIYTTNQRIAWIAQEVIEFGRFVGPTSESIEYFIRVARESLKRNNFNTFFQIVAALGLPAVVSVRSAWSNVASDKKALYESYLELCSSDDDYYNYRRLRLAARGQPCILCVQVLLREIILIETSGPWIVGGRIDLQKTKAMCDAIYSYLPKKQSEDLGVAPYDVQIDRPDSSLLQCLSSEESGSYRPHASSISSSTGSISGRSNSRSNSTASGRSLSKAGRMTCLLQTYLMDEGMERPTTLVSANETNETVTTVGIADEAAIQSSSSPCQVSAPSFLSDCMIGRDGIFDFLRPAYSSRNIFDGYEDINLRHRNKASVQSRSDHYSSGRPRSFTNDDAISNPSYSVQGSHALLLAAATPPGREGSRRSSGGGNGGGGGGLFSKVMRTLSFNSSKSSKKPFYLHGNDVTLSLIQSLIQRTTIDMHKLMEESQALQNVEAKRLAGKLHHVGLI